MTDTERLLKKISLQRSLINRIEMAISAIDALDQVRVDLTASLAKKHVERNGAYQLILDEIKKTREEIKAYDA